MYKFLFVLLFCLPSTSKGEGFLFKFVSMATIMGMVRRLNSVKLELQVPIIIEENERELVSLNQAQLYNLGVDSDGKELKPYSAMTERYKRENNQPYDRTTLKDSGAFYRGMYVQANSKLTTFDSDDIKTKDLTAKYGTKILGLTKESKKTFSFGSFYDGIKKHITAKTGLKFT